jgi:hypothetical protein
LVMIFVLLSSALVGHANPLRTDVETPSLLFPSSWSSAFAQKTNLPLTASILT